MEFFCIIISGHVRRVYPAHFSCHFAVILASFWHFLGIILVSYLHDVYVFFVKTISDVFLKNIKNRFPPGPIDAEFYADFEFDSNFYDLLPF